MLIEKLLAAITFHYDHTRLEYLKRVCLRIPSLAFDYKVLVVTNAEDENSLNKIRVALQSLPKYELISHPVIGHPYFLTWAHLPIFKKYFLSDANFSHFMYLEDDIQIAPHNINYFLRGRHELRELGFYPSFIRYEVNCINKRWYATDITKLLQFKKLSKIELTFDYVFLNSPQPYQGMYLMDQEMMSEFFNSPASSPDFGSWHIREKATQALTFVDVPKHFSSRNLLGYNVSKKIIDPGALIEHLPGNYANDPCSPFGKVPIEDLIRF
jgi:hypothetical protein